MNTVPEFYRSYIECTNDTSFMEQLNQSTNQISLIMDSINEQTDVFGDLEVKWSFKEIFPHIIDCKCIFSYRALRLYRGEKQILLSFDQDGYLIRGEASLRDVKSLKREFLSVRESTILMFSFFSGKQWQLKGKICFHELTVNILEYITVVT